MALNNDTNFPPSGPAPYRIDRSWCLGDSLPYLNANFTNFDTRIDNVSSNLQTQVNNVSATIRTDLTTAITNIQGALKIAQGEYAFTAATQTTTINLAVSGFNPSGPAPFIMASIMDTNNSGQGGHTADRVILNVSSVTPTSFVLYGATSTDISGGLDAAPRVRWLAIQNNLPSI